MLPFFWFLACTPADDAPRWVRVTGWDPVSQELLDCPTRRGPPVHWVAVDPSTVSGAMPPDDDAVPDLPDHRVGRVVTRDGPTWVVDDCEGLGDVLSPTPPPPQGAAMVELLEMAFADDPERVDVLSRRTGELDDPKQLLDFALELADAQDTADAAARFAEQGIALERDDPMSDPWLVRDLQAARARALWSTGREAARKEAVALQRQVADETRLGHARFRLHGFEDAMGLARTEAPPRSTAEKASVDEVRDLSEVLSRTLGRWSPELQASLAEVVVELDGAPELPGQACRRVQEALQTAGDGHLLSHCSGQPGWSLSTSPLRAAGGPFVASLQPLPTPDAVVEGGHYEAQRLGVDGTLAPTGVVVAADPEHAKNTASATPWALQILQDDGLPGTAIVTVSTTVLAELSSVPGGFDAFVATAETAAAQELVVLDLRGNSGGAYGPAYEWLRAFSDTAHTLPAFQHRQRSGLWLRDQGSLVGSGPPLRSRFVILVDEGTASSGEAFAVLARQLPGSVLVGRPTRGMLLANGHTRSHHLPRLGLQLVYGDAAIRWELLHPIADGVGLFPDLWYLDDEGIVQAVRRHAAGG